MIIQLLYSSHLFLFNSIYAYHINEKIMCSFLLMVYLFSAIHYITDKNDSVYHYMDCIMSRTATIVLFLNSFKYSKPYYCIMAINNIILSYGISRCIFIIYNDTTWIYSHMYFHVLTNFCLFVSLKDCLSKRNMGCARRLAGRRYRLRAGCIPRSRHSRK